MCETSKCHNFLIFQPIFIRFSLLCLKFFTLSSEIKLNLLWSSSLMFFAEIAVWRLQSEPILWGSYSSSKATNSDKKIIIELKFRSFFPLTHRKLLIWFIALQQESSGLGWSRMHTIRHTWIHHLSYFLKDHSFRFFLELSWPVIQLWRIIIFWCLLYGFEKQSWARMVLTATVTPSRKSFPSEPRARRVIFAKDRKRDAT